MEILKNPIYLLLIILILFFLFLPSYTKLCDLKKNSEDLEEKIKELQRKNITLQEEKENLERDHFYIEKAAREKLGVVKKGEVIYKIVPEEKK